MLERAAQRLRWQGLAAGPSRLRGWGLAGWRPYAIGRAPSETCERTMWGLKIGLRQQWVPEAGAPQVKTVASIHIDSEGRTVVGKCLSL